VMMECVGKVAISSRVRTFINITPEGRRSKLASVSR
jgi:hypothetical protein